ncbi:glycoside hydrolase superfamily [Globomyces pollinis-pini]|nr:glycoside hydrolase superfamily [Globomyces pollinis-pini]
MFFFPFLIATMYFLLCFFFLYKSTGSSPINIENGKGNPGIAEVPSVLPPLHTKGNQILDSMDRNVHLHCVSWSGAHTEDYLTYGIEYQPLKKLVDLLEDSKFNCVRFQFSAELMVKNPKVASELLQKNSQFIDKPALDIFDEIVKEITGRKIMLILDYHMLDAGWCCTHLDDNGGWSNSRWSFDSVKENLVKMAQRHKDNQYVIGIDLRNEIRPRIKYKKILGQDIITEVFYPNWGRTNDANDWSRAATELGNSMLDVNPNWIAFIQGIFEIHPDQVLTIIKGGKIDGIPQSLKGVVQTKIKLKVDNRVVYSSHDYQWHYAFDWDKDVKYEDFRRLAESTYGFASNDHPFLLGEFGTTHDDKGVNGQYWKHITRYITEKKFHWCIWEWAGVEQERRSNKENTYGILNVNHDDFASKDYMKSIQSIMF